MKHFKVIVVGGLCASLLSNFILFRKLDVLDNNINNVSNYQSQVVSAVNAQVGNVNNAIKKIKEEQNWLSAVNVKTVSDDTDRNKAEVSFEWQVKELQKDAEVLFNYRMGEETEYVAVKAEARGNGLFRVVVPVEVNPEPNWNLQISRDDMSGKEMRAIEEKKEAFAKENSRAFHYYISVSRDEILKSNEVNIAHIEDIGARYYGYLEVRTEINKNDNYSLSVMSGKMYDTSIDLEEVYLEKYNNGQLIVEEKLVKDEVIYEGGMPDREDIAFFRTKPSEEKMKFSSLVLKVKYSDGSVFEREVYGN